jgi:hypothetical protein
MVSNAIKQLWDEVFCSWLDCLIVNPMPRASDVALSVLSSLLVTGVGSHGPHSIVPGLASMCKAGIMEKYSNPVRCYTSGH